MTPPAPDPHTRRAWLRLARSRGLGATGLARLVERYRDPRDALDYLHAHLDTAPFARVSLASEAEVLAEMDTVERLGLHLLLSCDPQFPHALSVLSPPPPVILAAGDLSLLDRPVCALVGSRNASSAGLGLARHFASTLGQNGWVTVSGLARGIDGAVHHASLDTGTIAVVAGGLDHIYPPEHAELHEAIAHKGLILSERRLGTIPRAQDFPRRNRLISGLALGTLVVEAAERSGSLITARLAAEQGREVMAIPGSPLDPRSKGTNRLLRDGAQLVDCPEDVIEILSRAHPPAPQVRETAPADLFDDPEPEAAANEPAPMPDEEKIADDTLETRLQTLLSSAPTPLDQLIRDSGYPASNVMALLQEWSLTGRVETLPGGRVRASAASPVSDLPQEAS